MEARHCCFAGVATPDGTRLCWYAIDPENDTSPTGIKAVIVVEGSLAVPAQPTCKVDGECALCVLPGGAHPAAMQEQ